MCIQEQFYVKANLSFYDVWVRRQWDLLCRELYSFFFREARSCMVGIKWIPRELLGPRVVRSEISHPDEPDCVKNYQEAVAEQWAKIPVTPYSFHRATAGSCHLDRVKLKGMFQPSGQWMELDELHFTKPSLFFFNVWVTRLAPPSH